MKHRIDIVRIRENYITIDGWAIGKKPESKVNYMVLDGKKQPLKELVRNGWKVPPKITA